MYVFENKKQIISSIYATNRTESIHQHTLEGKLHPPTISEIFTFVYVRFGGFTHLPFIFLISFLTNYCTRCLITK
jgi:hypothetical protein